MNDDDLEYQKRFVKAYDKVKSARSAMLILYILNIFVTGMFRNNYIMYGILIMSLLDNIGLATTMRELVVYDRKNLMFQKTKAKYNKISIMFLAVLITLTAISIINYMFIIFVPFFIYRAYHEYNFLKIFNEDFIDGLKKKLKEFKESLSINRNIVPVPTS